MRGVVIIQTSIKFFGGRHAPSVFFFDFWLVGQNYPQLPEDVDESFDHEKICTGDLVLKPRLLR